MVLIEHSTTEDTEDPEENATAEDAEDAEGIRGRFGAGGLRSRPAIGRRGSEKRANESARDDSFF